MTIRTRFAPSPTDDLHIGGVRTALFSSLYARRHEGAFVLRIEDTDRTRSTAEARQGILEGLHYYLVRLGWSHGDKECMSERDVKMGAVAQPLRVAITGNSVSPPMGATLVVLGRERTLERVAAAMERLEARS